LLELAGVGYGFNFNYRLFGPFSDELQVACDDADALGLIREREKSASWGGSYYVFTSEGTQIASTAPKTRTRKQLLKIAVDADPVELELAVTAAFLAANKVPTPWHKVAACKPSKATDVRMTNAKALYREFMRVDTPKALPSIV